MTVREVLCKARKLLSDKKRWCVGSWHTTSRNGLDQYCALGALNKIGGDTPERNAARTTLQASAKELYGSQVIVVNDHRGYEATLKMFDHAIEKACEAEGGHEHES